MTIHSHEKRHGRIWTMQQLSCAWAQVCKTEKPDHLLYKMELRYCIRCNRDHWFFTERIEFEQAVIDPNEYWYSELIEMGYFAQFDDTTAPND